MTTVKTTTTKPVEKTEPEKKEQTITKTVTTKAPGETKQEVTTVKTVTTTQPGQKG